MIFVDSSYLISRLIINERLHSRAVELDKDLVEKKVINSTVLTETMNSFTNYGGKSTKKFFLKLLDIHEVIYLSPEDYHEAMELFYYYDSSINFSDCTILQSMQKLGINKIVSFDDDFLKVKGLSVIK